MILTPASTSWSASSWAAAVGTASTPTTMSSSSTTWRSSSGARTVVGPDVRGRDRLAEVAGAEQRDVVLAAGPQDLADLGDQRDHVVAHAALAELPEAGQVAADLRGVHVRVVRELLRGDRVLAHLLRLGQDLEVARQPRRHAERQAFAAAFDELHAPAVELLVKAH